MLNFSATSNSNQFVERNSPQEGGYIMSSQLRASSLGKVVDQIPAMTHICHVFCDDEDRNETLLKFLLSSLKIGDCAACYSQKANEREITALLNKNGLSYGALLSSGAFTLSNGSDIYLTDNYFDPDRMITVLEDYCQESKELGFPAVWIITEMASEIQTASGGNRLLEYEHKLDVLLDTYPAIMVCQYDARTFDETTILNLKKAHPYLVSKGEIARNPIFNQFSELV